MGLGGNLMTPEGLPAFNDENGLTWVNLLQAYSEAGPAEFFTDNDLTLFNEGHAGMIIDGTWNRSVLAEAIGAQNLAVDPWPIYGGGTLSGFVQAESIYLSPRALEEEYSASLKFLQYFLLPQSQAAVAEVGLIPALSGSPVNLAASQVQISDRLTAQSMLARRCTTTHHPSDIYSTQMDIALKSIFEGGVPPNEALQRAEEAILTGSATPAP
jgi:ABC-type glycerol-3-phosphate transport system substrate-binding protein